MVNKKILSLIKKTFGIKPIKKGTHYEFINWLRFANAGMLDAGNIYCIEYFMLSLAKFYINKSLFPVKSFNIIRIMALVFVIGLMFGPNNIRAAVGDIYYGRAKDFNNQLNRRYEFIRNSKNDTVFISPLKNIPTVLYVDDITTDPYDWRNQVYAIFFGKKAIVIKND